MLKKSKYFQLTINSRKNNRKYIWKAIEKYTTTNNMLI